jgi:acyl transferase domain-containing protein
MTGSDDEKRRRALLQLARRARREREARAQLAKASSSLKPFRIIQSLTLPQRIADAIHEFNASPTVQQFRREREWLAEAELELRIEEAKQAEAKAAVQKGPTPEPLLDDDQIREEIRRANQEAEGRGEPWPNCKAVAKIVQPRLKARDVKASINHIENIALEREFTAKRRAIGRKR